MSAIKTSLEEHAWSALQFCDLIDKEVRAMKLENEQWFINW